jgi:hypothetical protein
MKNLLAILAIVVLSTTFTFADTWTPAPATGTFTGTVYCIPEIYGPTAPVFLGNFFTGTAPVSVTGSLVWDLYGPKAPAVYTIVTTVIPVGGLQDDGTSGAYLAGAWDGAYLDADIQASAMTCKGAISEAAFKMTFNASTVIPGALPGGKTWTLTVTASASI